MTLPNTRLLPRGTKLRLTREYPRESISGNPLPPIPAGEVLTVQQDFGAGRVNVFCDFLGRLSEIVYLSESNCMLVDESATP